MGLLDEVIAESAHPVRKTRLDEIREMMDPDERKELELALANDDINLAALARVLTKRGYPIGETTLRQYKRRM